MELGLAPAQVDEIEPDMLWHMRQHAQRVRLEDAAMLMVAFHDPAALQRMIRQAQDEAEGINSADRDLLDWMEASKRGNS